MLEWRRALIEIWAPRCGLSLSPEFEAALVDTPREKIVYGGWRSGKSTGGAFEILLDYFDNHFGETKALYWLLGPQYGQADQEYTYLAQWFSKLGLLREFGTAKEGSNTVVLKDGT